LDDIRFDLAEHYQHNGNRMRFAAINLFCKEVLKKERKDLYLKIPRSRIKNKDVLTNDQVEKLLAIAQTKRKSIYAVILTLYQCGLRKMEACNLNVKDVNFETMEILLRNTKTGDGVVSMTTSLAAILRDYINTGRTRAQPDEQALFLTRSGKRIGEHFVRNHLKKCAKEARINARVYPHVLRASCITHLLNQGVNPFTVQRHARHKDFRTTMIYNRPTQQQMKADIERVFNRRL
jgi:site-specific recombinase XerD